MFFNVKTHNICGPLMNMFDLVLSIAATDSTLLGMLTSLRE